MSTLIVRDLQHQDYLPTWEAMRAFVDSKDNTRADELWLLEHPSIFTLGQNGKEEHVLDPGTIPVQHVDRGGQVTYHGPGQLIAYVLLNLRRKRIGVKALVKALEQTVIDLLQQWQIDAHTREKAPGVYVANAKICSLGLRIRHGWSYHGLSLNVNMDLRPFSKINPCGIPELNMTQLCDLGGPVDMAIVKQGLAAKLIEMLEYKKAVCNL